MFETIHLTASQTRAILEQHETKIREAHGRRVAARRRANTQWQDGGSMEWKETFLKEHKVGFDYFCGRLHAHENFTQKIETGETVAGFELVDVHDWTRKQMYDWMGY